MLLFVYRLTLEEILAFLDDDDQVSSAKVFTTPPENHLLSDEDSGDEESPNINHMTGNQLRAEAELHLTKYTLSGIEHIIIEDGETMAFPPESPSCSAEANINATTTSTDLENGGRYIPRKKAPAKERKWRNVDITPNKEREWTRPDFLNQNMTPVQLFELFWNDEVINLIVNESKSYALLKGKHSFDVSCSEIKLVIAILLLSGYCSVSRHRLYWDTRCDTHHPGVSSAISRNRFEEILRYFHVNDNNALDAEDKFTKIRPLWKLMDKAWLKYFPGDAHVSIDESMVPYFGHHGTKQHMHGKPIRFGFKVWSLCNRLGYVIQAEPYQGASTGNTNPDLGVGGSVVMDLVKRLPEGSGYSVFVDNFFTSLRLLDELKKHGHDGTGTIRVNRVEKAPLLDNKDAKKLQRGDCHQLTDIMSGTTLVQYHDNNIVILASNKCGVAPLGTCTRWSAKDRKRVAIRQPSCISQYNLYMGGVDRLDQNISVYRVSIRMKKWYWQLLMFLLNASMNNAYQLYRLTPSGRVKGALDYLGFIRYVVEAYLGMYACQRAVVGRARTATKKRVPDEVRLDGRHHIIISNKTQVRCGLCHKNTLKKCKKCNIGCHVNCFESFHS